MTSLQDMRSSCAGQRHDEKFVTLDGQERTMDENVLMICDGEKAVGIAGIMGGENSMITDNVKTMLFEAACFDGTNIRLSSKRVGLRTDASGKFEKGLDPNNAQAAIDRACQLIEELGAGEVVGGMADVYTSEKRAGNRVKFEPDKINAPAGNQCCLKSRCWLTLRKLTWITMRKPTKSIAPTFRQDILRTGRPGRGSSTFLRICQHPDHPAEAAKRPPENFRSR